VSITRQFKPIHKLGAVNIFRKNPKTFLFHAKIKEWKFSFCHPRQIFAKGLVVNNLIEFENKTLRE
jgi:hypothetical protein